MTSITPVERTAWFRALDRLFWLAWLALPLMVWLSYRASGDPAALAAELPAGQAECLKLLPSPERMSPEGRALYWGLFLFQLSIYVVLLGALHVVVHRFAQGRIFVAETLATLSWLGATLVVWPFLETAVTQTIAYALKARGDLPAYVASFAVDVAPIAVGLFLIALRHVLDHALAIKAENDLTI